MFKPLPLSISTFEKIVSNGSIYVDKTRYIYELVRRMGGLFFISRPRRFGKTLTVSAMEEILRGNRELFKGLWIYEESDYDWEAYPVIRLDFSETKVKNAENLEDLLEYYLAQFAEEHNLTLNGFEYQTRFASLIKQLGKEKRIAILIDEYDKLVLDHIHDIKEAVRIRDVLKAFYGVIKAMDPYLQFVFVTGVSKFTKVGIFSDLNNLIDITVDEPYATMFGITQDELEHYFGDYIYAFVQQTQTPREELLEQIRDNYNGFRFAAYAETVYNPYSTIMLFEKRKFANYWFETGTPSFIMDVIKKKDYDIEWWDGLRVEELAFSTHDIKRLSAIPLLCQAGYLTIRSWEHNKHLEIIYTLTYPNYEVKNAFFAYLLNAYCEVDVELTSDYLTHLVDALQDHSIDRFFNILKVYYANIDYDLHVKHEKYYQTIFYSLFLLIGMRVDAEVKTNQGRIDAVIALENHIYLFEFKRDRTAQDALDQIENNAYYEKYQLQGKPITLVGVNFDSEKGQIEKWKDKVLEG